MSFSATAQTRRDPRAIALAGAYGSLARGVFAVDYNPANLVIPNEYDSYRILVGLGTNLSTNFLSIKQYNKYNGKNLEAGDGHLKKEFLNDIPDEGWRVFTDLYFPLPLISYSIYNRAISSDLIVIGDLGLPKGLLNFVFDENPIGETLDLDFNEEVMAVIQWGYSLAFPVSGVYLGITAKYLQGLAYIGLNPDSSYGSITTYFEPERTYIDGYGQYYFQQSLGGRGFALDIGLTTQEINGYRLGLSLTNLFGFITWNKSTLVSRMVPAEEILPWEGDFYKYVLSIDEARFDKFFGKASVDDIFKGKGYKIRDTTAFRVSYPSLLRFSASKILEENLTLASDLVVGFEDRLYSFGAWKWCLGLESTKSRRFPLRVGLSLGGHSSQELTFGSGFHWGLIHLDWALGFNHGFWPTTTTGLNFNLLCYSTRKAKTPYK
ncbi:MAG TPA: DUF5723 family protein [Candidatus Marinimicrobia bacterium]|nr:DUF5723 family protein [Candidatus Neomarinimicrobiota bacterium]HRS51498.1 DUF5723 family protein [Candidatus Neomarinimicrobiota bacterium]HRU92768.1 DUF5723 family protein [Candidatus Neomarinimicrobiota bacterium]